MTAPLAAIVPVPADAAGLARYRIDGSAVLVRVVRHLLEAVADPAAVVVVVGAANSVESIKTLLAGAGLDDVQVLAADDPADWMGCLTAGVDHLARQPNPTRYLLVHDLRQPVTSAAVRDRVVAELVEGADVVLALLPVTDSVKAVDPAGTVTATIDRSTLRAAQFPRGYATAALARLMHAGGADEIDAATASAMPITAVEGDADVFIADLPRDGAFVEAVMASRPG